IRQAYQQEMKRLEKDRSPDRRNSAEMPAEKLRLLAAALRALGRLGAPDAFQILEAHTKDRSASVRSGAYVGLVAVGPKGIAAAREALSDRAAEVRAAAALALAERGAEGQAELVPTLAKPNSDRTAIFSALDHAGPTPAVADALLAVLAEGGADAAVAARLLGRLATREAVQPLLDLLDDPAAVGRREALLALGRIGDPAAADAVARDLSHESPDVRAAAAEALGLLGTSPPPEALDALRGDYYRQVRQSAEAALARIAKAPEGRAAK
ncbi:MAG TPA: HEAT repeat domain-containing protein, partial [Myxococcaceae bacterium]|nr:HEAT repeat domain-containing protein [Myxococcaceae bacterium]